MAFPTGSTMSGTKSDTRGSTYKYSTGVQPNGTPSIGNWNTGGSFAGIGDKNGVYAPDGSRIGGQMTDPRLTGGPNIYQSLLGMAGGNDEVTSGPIGPALGPQGLPNVQVPMGYPPASLPSFLRNAVQYGNPFRWPTARRADMANMNAAYNRMGSWINQEYNPLSSVSAPRGTQNTSTIPYNPNGGGYTNINKNNQGNFANYPGGNSATYSNMGNDFRSNNFSPSSYPR